jgi:hypothetical protein
MIWFGKTNELGYAALPLAFNSQNLTAIDKPKKADVKKLVEFLDRKIGGETKSEFSLAVQMRVTFTKDSRGSGIGVRPTNDPSAPEMRLSEQDFQARFPLDYQKLLQRVRQQLPGIKINNKFTLLMRELRADPNLCHTRYLDPQTRKGQKKFYSEAILSRISRDKVHLDFHV